MTEVRLIISTDDQYTEIRRSGDQPPAMLLAMCISAMSDALSSKALEALAYAAYDIANDRDRTTR